MTAKITNPYIERERNWHNEPTKQPQREKIIDFMLPFLKETKSARLLSMPSLHWSFESQFMTARPEATFVGIEHIWGVIELGAPYMPGKRPVHFDIGLRQGDFRGMRTDKAKWLWASAGTFLGGVGRSMFRGRDKKRNFAAEFKANNCAWLDFQSQLCSEVESSIEGIQSNIDIKTKIAPVVVSVLGCRDDFQSKEDRVRRICELLSKRRHRSFGLCESWSYSSGDSAMLSVAGILFPK